MVVVRQRKEEYNRFPFQERKTYLNRQDSFILLKGG